MAQNPESERGETRGVVKRVVVPLASSVAGAVAGAYATYKLVQAKPKPPEDSPAGARFAGRFVVG